MTIGSREAYSRRGSTRSVAGLVYRSLSGSWRLASRWTLWLNQSARRSFLLLPQHVVHLLLLPRQLLPLLSATPVKLRSRQYTQLQHLESKNYHPSKFSVSPDDNFRQSFTYLLCFTAFRSKYGQKT